LPADLVARFHALLGGAALHNLYGPTEAAVDVTAWPCPPDPAAARVPIGGPIDNLHIHLLDAGGQPVPIGVPGELHIGGVGVGRGYLAQPDLTAERFVPDACGARPGARLYRTGDLARRRPDGVVEFLGRVDHQVKIRGHRIELGEVEHALRSCPDVRDAAVAVRGAGTERQLAAYVVMDGGPAALARLRRELRERLPEAMVPAVWVALPGLPLLANGKVDRRALPEPAGAARTAAVVPPRGYLEEMVAGIWMEVLGIAELSVGDNLFDLGAHSLMATQVVSRLGRELGLELPLRRIFELPTVALQAAEIQERRQAAAPSPPPPIAPLPRDGWLPLSFSQQRLWFFDRWAPQSAVFNVPTALGLDGELALGALAGSLDLVVRRHEVLRSRFLDVGGEPVQVVAPPHPCPRALVDLKALPPARRQEELARREREAARRPFDLERGPLVRTVVLRLDGRAHVALLTLHHIAADGWSLRILTAEVGEAYRALRAGRPAALPELPIQFVDYAAWQRRWLQGEVLARELAFWKEQLAGAPAETELPLDRPRGQEQRFRGRRRTCALPADLTAALRALARETRGTLFMVLVAAVGALLRRYSRQPDVVIGTLIANRHRREVESLIGFFVNTLALRTRWTAELGWREAIARIRETTLEVYAHQDLPFEKLVEELNPRRRLGLTPLFQVLAVLQNT
ncbi:MAG TPA: condensation domain-containing protein, partial [Thermoanaerobaculia bacterium]|nr:condensation domain-containing protein [Thermoanaerobaculia bacterium]